MTISTMSYDLSESEKVRTQLQRSLRSSGGSPSGVFELLCYVLDKELWKSLPRTRDGEGFTSFVQFIEASEPYGLSMEQRDFKALLKVKASEERGGVSDTSRKFDKMREDVLALMNGDVPPAAKQGEIGNGRSREHAMSSTHNESSTGVLARLKRDRPDVAADVVAGRLSANAAAIHLGWRKPRIVVSSPESVARSLRRYMPADDLGHLAKLLLEDR